MPHICIKFYTKKSIYLEINVEWDIDVYCSKKEAIQTISHKIPLKRNFLKATSLSNVNVVFLAKLDSHQIPFRCQTADIRYTINATTVPD